MKRRAASARSKNDRVAHDAGRLLAFLSANRRRLSPLLILTHDYPDPDALASAFALATLAQSMSMTTKIVYGGIIGRMENRNMMRLLKIPASRLRPIDLKRMPHVALVDTQPSFHNNSFPENRRAALVIDQHRSATPPNAELAIVNVDSGATSVVLAQALLAKRIAIPPNVATALIYGILTDTLNLYRADQPIIVETYMRLLPFADVKSLARIQNPTRSRRFFLTLAAGLRTAVISRGLIVSHLGAVETPDLVSQTADFFLNYDRAHWTLCSGRYKGRLYVSLRCENLNDEAGEILRAVFDNKAHAGGHGAIAGGSLPVGRDVPDARWRRHERQIETRLYRRLRLGTSPDFSRPFHDRS